MFTKSNQDSDQKEPLKHPKVGFCPLTSFLHYLVKSSPLLECQHFKTELYVHVLSGWAIAAYKVVDQKLRGSTVMCCEEFAVRRGIGEGDFVFT